MKEFVFRFSAKDDVYRTLRLLNMCETFGLDYDVDVELVGKERNLSDLLFIVTILGNPVSKDEEVPF